MPSSPGKRRRSGCQWKRQAGRRRRALIYQDIRRGKLNCNWPWQAQEPTKSSDRQETSTDLQLSARLFVPKLVDGKACSPLFFVFFFSFFHSQIDRKSYARLAAKMQARLLTFSSWMQDHRHNYRSRTSEPAREAKYADVLSFSFSQWWEMRAMQSLQSDRTFQKTSFSAPNRFQNINRRNLRKRYLHLTNKFRHALGPRSTVSKNWRLKNCNTPTHQSTIQQLSQNTAMSAKWPIATRNNE